MSEDITLFTEVDRSGDPDFFIRFLVKEWWGALRDLDAAGRFLAGFSAFIVSGTRGASR
jgi:hypothetical protein